MFRHIVLLAACTVFSACVTIPQQRRIDPVWPTARDGAISTIGSSRSMAKDKMDEIDAGNAAMPAASKAKPKKAVLDGRYAAVKKQFTSTEESEKILIDWAKGKDSSKSDIVDADSSKLMNEARELSLRYGKLYADFNSLGVEYNALTSY